MLRLGKKCLAFDKDYDDEGMDLLTDMGFVTAFVWALRLQRFGLTPWGTLCSSWVWVSRSTTKRTGDNVLGDESVPCVQQGNIMVSRMCLIWHIVKMRECVYILEQPQSSLMFSHPRVHDQIRHTNTWMGCFGAGTAKPTKLGSNVFSVVARLHRRLSPAVRATLNSEGVTSAEADIYGRSRRVSGGPKLKSTQAYTPQFAHAMVQSWRKWQLAQRAAEETELEEEFEQGVIDPAIETLMQQRAYDRLHVPTAGIDNWPDAQVNQIPMFIMNLYAPH